MKTHSWEPDAFRDSNRGEYLICINCDERKYLDEKPPETDCISQSIPVRRNMPTKTEQEIIKLLKIYPAIPIEDGWYCRMYEIANRSFREKTLYRMKAKGLIEIGIHPANPSCMSFIVVEGIENDKKKSTRAKILTHLAEYGPTGPYNLWLVVPTKNLMTLADAIATLQMSGEIEKIQEGKRVSFTIPNNPEPCPRAERKTSQASIDELPLFAKLK